MVGHDAPNIDNRWFNQWRAREKYLRQLEANVAHACAVNNRMAGLVCDLNQQIRDLNAQIREMQRECFEA